MERKLRAASEFDRLLAEQPDIAELHAELVEIPNLVVQPDGTGSSLFKVYLKSHTEQFEAFLWMNATLHKSYVQWSHQRELAEECRAVLGTVVKERSNPDGSELQREVGVETIARIARQYAELADRQITA